MLKRPCTACRWATLRLRPRCFLICYRLHKKKNHAQNKGMAMTLTMSNAACSCSSSTWLPALYHEACTALQTGIRCCMCRVADGLLLNMAALFDLLKQVSEHVEGLSKASQPARHIAVSSPHVSLMDSTPPVTSVSVCTHSSTAARLLLCCI